MRRIAIATTTAFLIFIILGVFNCSNLIMQSQMTADGPHHSMTDCIPGKNCGMDIGNHIAVWQGMIATNLNTNVFSLIASLLLIGVFLNFVRSLTSHTSPLLARFLYYGRHHRDETLYNYFVQIFSSGILQPKIFA